MKLYQVDAFTNTLFKGNPAAVCPLEKWLPDATMQSLAMENNLAETAFFVPLPNGNFHIRWFTPNVEVDLCGHATLASAWVLYHELGYSKDSIVFESKSGPLTVTRNGAMLTLDFPANEAVAIDAPARLLEGLQITGGQVYKAAWDYLVVVPDEASVIALQPDFSVLGKVDARGVIVTAKSNSVDFVSRCFYPRCGINEDPVTGSAHTITAAYWSGVLQKKQLTARQLSHRGGELLCEVTGDRVLMSGEARLYMRGEYHLE